MLSSAGMVLIAPLGSGLEMVRENNPSPTPAKANPTRTEKRSHHLAHRLFNGHTDCSQFGRQGESVVLIGLRPGTSHHEKKRRHGAARNPESEVSGDGSGQQIQGGKDLSTGLGLFVPNDSPVSSE